MGRDGEAGYPETVATSSVAIILAQSLTDAPRKQRLEKSQATYQDRQSQAVKR